MKKDKKDSIAILLHNCYITNLHFNPDFLQNLLLSWQDMTNPFVEAHVQKSLEILTTLRMYDIFD